MKLLNRLIHQREINELAKRASSNIRHSKQLMAEIDSDGDCIGAVMLRGIEAYRKSGDLQRLRDLVREQETRATLEEQLEYRAIARLLRGLNALARGSSTQEEMK